LIFLSVITSLILLYCLCQLSVMDLIICCLAFIPTGWGLLLVSINWQFIIDVKIMSFASSAP
jgi:hypothetical protein